MERAHILRVFNADSTHTEYDLDDLFAVEFKWLSYGVEEDMYLIEKLVRLENQDPFSTDGRIAHHLLTSLSSEYIPGVKDFCYLVGVSKASLQRFFSCAGFKSWKDLAKSLQDDQRRNNTPLLGMLDETEESAVERMCVQFIHSCLDAGRIVIYGDLYHLHYLEPFIQELIAGGKSVILLDYWSLARTEEVLFSLKEKDLFVVFDLNMRSEVFLEFSLNRPYMLSLEQIKDLPFKKVHLCLKKPKQASFLETVALPLKGKGSPQSLLESGLVLKRELQKQRIQK